jgi:hypothetical protein
VVVTLVIRRTFIDRVECSEIDLNHSRYHRYRVLSVPQYKEIWVFEMCAVVPFEHMGYWQHSKPLRLEATHLWTEGRCASSACHYVEPNSNDPHSFDVFGVELWSPSLDAFALQFHA